MLSVWCMSGVILPMMCKLAREVTFEHDVDQAADKSILDVKAVSVEDGVVFPHSSKQLGGEGI